jgi:hypothetical protein
MRRYTALKHVPPHIKDAWRMHNTVCGFGYAALRHLVPGPERTELEAAVAKFPDRFEKLEDDMEAGDLAAAYRDIADLLLLAAMLGASLQAVPEIAAKVKARAAAAARNGKKVKDDKMHAALVLAVIDVCKERERKLAKSMQCAKEIRPDVLRKLGLPETAKKPGLSQIKTALIEACG